MAKKVVRRTDAPAGSGARRPASTTPTAGTARRVTVATAPARSAIPMRRPRINPVWLVAGLIVIAAIAGFVWLSQRGGEGAASREILLPDEGRAHVNVGDPLVYQNNPPASGTHYPSTADWGFYEETISEGFWVHNLEHGGIVVLYKCPDGNCPERVQQLQALYDATPPSKYGNKKIVIVPYENMEAEFMAVAWNIQLPLMEFNQDAILGFYSRNVDHGPEDVA